MSDAFGPLLAADSLRALGHRPDAHELRVLDLRWYLGGRRGADEYARGHLPGAVFVDLDADLTPPQGPGRHPIPPAPRFEDAMRRCGVSQRSRVVVYDDAGGSVAARLWWLLRHYGHAAVAVLDGGIDAWVACGGSLTTELPRLAPGDFRAAPPSLPVLDRGAVDRLRRDPAGVLLDARPAERYAGLVEPIDARPGHIPGALPAPWAENLSSGLFRSPDELRERFYELGVREGSRVVCYCGSGVTACHNLLALELAGLGGAALYEGSWSDWARDPALPAALGPEPGR